MSFLPLDPLRSITIYVAQYGVELDVPAATILSIFGLRAQVRDIIFVASLYSDLS